VRKSNVGGSVSIPLITGTAPMRFHSFAQHGALRSTVSWLSTVLALGPFFTCFALKRAMRSSSISASRSLPKDGVR
jgi:hypothetical protein